jgi:hypothetical protein
MENKMSKINMGYIKGKVVALRKEYDEPDKRDIVKARGGKCELCDAKEGDKMVFGPTHYIKKHVVLTAHIHLHVIKMEGAVHKIAICCLCHLGYHLYARLDPDARFGTKTVREVADGEKPKHRKYNARASKKYSKSKR